MFLNVCLMSFCRSDQFKSLYKCVETFELIRSTKGHQSNIQKHDLLPKLYNQAGESLATGGKVWLQDGKSGVWLQEGKSGYRNCKARFSGVPTAII